MQRNYKLIISIIVLAVSSLCAFAQDTAEYKDVFLDGKPAKLNVVTGEVKLVNSKDKIVKTKTDNIPQGSDKHNNPNISNEDSNSDFYIVKEGETLFEVSKAYNVSLTELKRANNLETTLISKGQKLRVRNLDAVTERITQVANNTASESYSESNNSNIHSVEKNETLFSLARRYNLSVNELKRQNNLNSNLIVVGQKLRVRDFETSNEVDNLSVWIVKKGDNLYRIALNNGTTVEAIKRLNGLKSNTIKIGQKLQLR